MSSRSNRKRKNVKNMRNKQEFKWRVSLRVTRECEHASRTVAQHRHRMSSKKNTLCVSSANEVCDYDSQTLWQISFVSILSGCCIPAARQRHLFLLKMSGENQFRFKIKSHHNIRFRRIVWDNLSNQELAIVRLPTGDFYNYLHKV